MPTPDQHHRRAAEASTRVNALLLLENSRRFFEDGPDGTRAFTNALRTSVWDDTDVVFSYSPPAVDPAVTNGASLMPQSRRHNDNIPEQSCCMFHHQALPCLAFPLPGRHPFRCYFKARVILITSTRLLLCAVR